MLAHFNKILYDQLISLLRGGHLKKITSEL